MPQNIMRSNNFITPCVICLFLNGNQRKGRKNMIKEENRWDCWENYINGYYSLVKFSLVNPLRLVVALIILTSTKWLHPWSFLSTYVYMKQYWKGTTYKNPLWKCAMTTMPHFELAMEELNILNVDAYNWLTKISPHH